MKYIEFINVSPIQFFDSTKYDDIDDIEIFDNPRSENIDDMNIVKVIHDYKDESINEIEIAKDDDNKTLIECLDDRDEDLLINKVPSIKVESKTLDISPNIPEIPTGNKDGVIAKIPVVLAQLVIPINITSLVDLPEEAIEIKDIKKSLNLIESVLLQPTNVLFIKGFVKTNIQYSTAGFLNLKGISGKIGNYTIDIPFECSTDVNFFTQPLGPIENTKEMFQYIDDDLSTFNQISEDFFNEIPFCKLLSSTIVEFDECVNPKDSKNNFIQLQEEIVIQIRMEVLQNQSVVVLSATNKTPGS